MLQRSISAEKRPKTQNDNILPRFYSELNFLEEFTKKEAKKENWKISEFRSLFAALLDFFSSLKAWHVNRLNLTFLFALSYNINLIVAFENKKYFQRFVL